MTTSSVEPPVIQRQESGNPLIAIGNEVVKGLRHGWAERTQIVIEMPLFISFMLLISFIVGQGQGILTTGRMSWSLDSKQTSWLFIGVAVYILVYLAIQKMFWRLLAEIQTGTLEQTYLSPLPSWVHTVVGREVAATVEAGIVVGVLYIVTNLAVRLELVWRWDALAPLAFVFLGTAGFSLVIAGLTLRWKRIEMSNDMVLLFVMFFSGVVIDVDRLPAVADYISPFLYLTHGNIGLRRIMLEDQGLSLWGMGGYVWLAATSLGWLLFGITVFRLCEYAAKRSGSLNRY